MKTISVYDSAMCCTTGVCGPSVDPKLAEFAGDLEWLKAQGVSVQRFNLAQEPERFIQISSVKEILERSGDEELPAILAEETLVSSGRFPSRKELAVMAGLDVSVTSGDDQKSDKQSATSGGSGCC